MRSSSTATVCARRRISSCSSVGAKLSIELNPFNDRAIGHTAAFTHRLQAVAAAPTLQFVQENSSKPCAGGSQRVADGNCSTIDVDPLPIRSRLTLPGKYDAGECFIDLNQVHLLQRQASPLKYLKRRGDRCGQHENRVIAGQGERDKARTRLKSQPLRGFPFHDEHRSCTIADLRGIARCNQAIWFKGWLEAGQLLKAGITADTLVLLEHTGRAIFVLHRNRNDLALETSFSSGLCGSTMTLQAELIEFTSA